MSTTIELDLRREKISLQVLYPPTPEERDSGKRTMGLRCRRRKILAAGPIPQPPDEERESDKRTTGVPISASVNEDRTTGKLSLQNLYAPSAEASFHLDGDVQYRRPPW
jgi:hypothetical protein